MCGSCADGGNSSETARIACGRKKKVGRPHTEALQTRSAWSLIGTEKYECCQRLELIKLSQREETTYRFNVWPGISDVGIGLAGQRVELPINDDLRVIWFPWDHVQVADLGWWSRKSV